MSSLDIPDPSATYSSALVSERSSLPLPAARNEPRSLHARCRKPPRSHRPRSFTPAVDTRHVAKSRLWRPLPRVQDINTHRFEIPHIACYDCHAMDRGSRCDESIPHGSWVWYVQLGAAQGHGHIDRQYSPFELG